MKRTKKTAALSHTPEKEEPSVSLQTETSQTPAYNGSATDTLQVLGRRRRAWVKATTRLTNQAKAILRNGDDSKKELPLKRLLEGASVQDVLLVQPLVDALDLIKVHRVQCEGEIEKTALLLPIAPWVDQVRGFGIKSLGILVGQAVSSQGCVFDADRPAKVWKRFGLAVFNGQRQRKVTGDPEEAIRQGYNPTRRSEVFVIGECLMKQNPEYKAVYDARKVASAIKHPDWTKGHCHMDAKRYMEKRFLRDLWREWHRVQPDLPTVPEFQG